MMSRRIMGKASFAELLDAEGRIQLYVSRDDLPEGELMYNTVFKKLLDIGDFIGVKGTVFRTGTGEKSVHVHQLTVLAKSLRPLPVVKKDKDGNVYDAFTDPELRYRQRYVDLIVNEGVKDVFLKRTKIINTMREFFNERGYLEVETPRAASHPGRCIGPSLHHAPQRSGHPALLAYCQRVVPQTPDRGRFRRGLRVFARLPQPRAWTVRTTPSLPSWNSTSRTRTTSG